jgi:hypothetical protein
VEASQVQQAQRPATEVEEKWIRCCERKLAKQVGQGKWESKALMRRSRENNSKKWHTVQIVIGGIQCPRCGQWFHIPPNT